MSEYDKARYDFWFAQLGRACSDVGDHRTAGEVAKVAGTSRNTAKKYLEAMVGMGVLTRVYTVAKNGADQINYTFTEWVKP